LVAAKIPASAVAAVALPLNLSDGKAGFVAHNADLPMNPASAMKLVTSFAALDLLGPAATWQTGFWATTSPGEDGSLRGDLYLKGSGDPSLSMERFWRLLRQLRVRGVTTITGDLVLDRSDFLAESGNPATFDNRPLRAYNVMPDGLLLDAFALRFIVRPEAGRARLLLESPNDNIVITANLKLDKSACDGWRERLALQSTPGLLSITGSFPERCGERTLLLAPLPPNRHIEGLFRALWRELGGSWQGKTREGIVPAEARILAMQESPPLADIVRDMNKWSNNVVARQLFLALGENDGIRARTEAAAVARITGWLGERRLDFPELVMENGSGLSRRERISAFHLGQLLVAAWRSAVMPEMLSSLPIAAVDGTMRKRLRDSVAAGRARVKTGTLDGVKTAAGYVEDMKGRRYAFAFFINHARAGRGQDAIDAFIHALVAAEIP
jgi:D-alanyl-D-alanine carboxypeptidase/D-alanyl-D-alanine-endopeptidase (penicillin-binding protein 4)